MTHRRAGQRNRVAEKVEDLDNQTPVAEGIGIGPDTRCTGTISKIILEVK